jgi:hypothetical protein
MAGLNMLDIKSMIVMVIVCYRVGLCPIVIQHVAF